MLLGIDHLVIAVPDPDAAAADLEAALGLAATGGGRHETAGTFNRLVFLGDTYLELMGVWDRVLAAAHPIGAAAIGALDAGTSGLVTWAIATDEARPEVAALQAAGSAIGDALPGERIRRDGGVVRWHVATAPPLAFDRPPFLIEHEMAGPEWSDEARGARAGYVHPFGGSVRVVGLELAVAEPAAVAADFARTVGVPFRPAPGAGPGDLEARVGDHAIRLVAAWPGPRPGFAVSSGLGSMPEPGPGARSGAEQRTGPVPAGGLGSSLVDPPARVGLLATTGERLLVDVCGVRFARL